MTNQQSIDKLLSLSLWLDKDSELYQAIAMAISALQQPERKTAKWIATTSLQEGQITWRDYKCSNCSHHREKPMNFCEVCGVKMER